MLSYYVIEKIRSDRKRVVTMTTILPTSQNDSNALGPLDKSTLCFFSNNKC